MVDIIRKYTSDFGKIYVQVAVGDNIIELNFNHDPTKKEIEDNISRINQTNIDISKIVIDEKIISSISILKEEYSKIKIGDKLTDAQKEMVEIMKPKSEVK